MARKELRFITVQQVADIHEKLLARDGGLPGYRLGANLSAVLERVRNNAQYGGPKFHDPSKVAALTTYAITVGHPFNDANKRTSLAAGVIVLHINGVNVFPNGVELREMIKAAAAGQVELEAFIAQYLDLLQESKTA